MILDKLVLTALVAGWSLLLALQWFGPGWLWFGLAVAGIYLWSKRRSAQQVEQSLRNWHPVNPALFPAPKSEYSGPVLAIPPDQRRQLQRRQRFLAAVIRIFQSWRSVALWLPGLALLTDAGAIWGGGPDRYVWGWFGVFLCVCNGLIFIPVGIWTRWRIGRVLLCFGESRRHAFDAAGRARWDIKDPLCRDRMSCCFESSEQAALALRLADLAEVTHMVYPDDPLVLVCGERCFDILRRWPEWAERPDMTFGDAVLDCCVDSSKRVWVLPDPPEVPDEPPPLSAYAQKVVARTRAEETPKLSESTMQEEFSYRPPMTEALFVRYWPTRREASIALTIRDLSVMCMDRPETLMCYPNDPMPYLVYLDIDWAECVEFFVGMEQEFGISIPEADATEILWRMNLAQVVRYVIEKQDQSTAAAAPGAEPAVAE